MFFLFDSIKKIFQILFIFFLIIGCDYNPLGGSYSHIDDGNRPFLNTPGSFDFNGILISDSTVQLSWSPAIRTDDYTVSFGAVSGDYSVNVLGCTNIKQALCTVPNLINGQKYYVKIFARNRFGKTSTKSEAVVTPKPFSLNLRARSNTALINWTDVTAGIGSTSYSLQYGLTPTSTNQIIPFIDNSYFLTGLADGFNYYFMVTASNLAGDITSLIASSLIINPPTAPSFAGLPVATSSQVTLNWNSSLGAGTILYTVAKSTTQGGPYNIIPGCTNVSGLTCTESTTLMVPGNNYYYVVYATNEGGDSPFSAETNVITYPGIPTGFVASAPNNSDVFLNWDLSPGNANITYNIYRSTINPVDVTNALNLIGSVNSSVLSQATSFTDSGPFVENTIYYYALTASNTSGISGKSEQQNISSALLTAPTSISATGVTSSSLNLSWSLSLGNDVINYTVYRSLNSAPSMLGTLVYSGTSLAYLDSGLSENTNYYYTIIAKNSRPNGTIQQSAKFLVTTALGTAINLSKQSVSISSASFQWSTANGNGNVTYKLYRSTTSTVNTSGTPIFTSNTAITYTDLSLNASSNYYYVVTVSNSQNTLASTIVLQITTLPNTPNAPTTVAKNMNVTISWPQSPSAGTASITYNIQRYRTISATPQDVSGCLNIPDSNRTCTDVVPVADDLPYYYIVKANTSGGSSPASSSPSIVTPISMFNSFSAATTPTQISLVWSGAAGGTSFLVYSSTTPGGSAPPSGSVTACVSSPCNISAAVGQNFYYTVVSSNTGTNSSASRVSNEISAYVHDSPITSIVAQTSQVFLTWSDVPNKLNYSIYYSTTSSAGIVGKTLGCDAGLTLSCTIAGLTNGVPYYFVIVVTKSVGGTFIGTEETATPIGLFSITSLSAVNTSSANIEWSTADGATSYDIKYGTSSGNYSSGLETVGSSVALPYLITGLVQGSNYYFMVSAKNASGEVNATSEVQLVMQIGTPTGLNISSVTKNTSILNWNIFSGNPSATYNIYRSDTNLSPFVANPTDAVCTVLSTLAINNTCTDSNSLLENSIYYYVISATNSLGESAISSPPITGITALNTAPIFNTATNINTTSLSLNWSLNVGNAAVTYKLYRSLTGLSTGWGSPIYTGADQTVSDSSLSESTTYYYKVSANNNAINAIDQDSASYKVTTSLQTAPVISSVTNVSSNSITVNWSLSVGNAPIVFKLYRSTSSNPVNWGTPIYMGNLLTYQDTNLNENSTYYYMVSATNDSLGATPINSLQFSAVTALSNPVILSKVSVSVNSVALKWSDVLGNAPVTYKLFRSTTLPVDTTGVPISTNSASNAYTDATVIESSIYYYVVTVNNAQNALVSTPALQIVTLPKTPTALTVNAVGNSIDLTWTVSSTAGNASITYSVQRSRSLGSGYAAIAACSNISNPLSCNDVVVADGAPFYYAIRASTVSGNSPAASTPTAVTPIMDINSINVTTNPTQIFLSWSGAAGASTYKVYKSLNPSQSSPSNGGTDSLCAGSPCTFVGVANQTIYYTIVASNSGTNSTATTLSSEVSATPLSAPLISADAKSSKVTINWNSVLNATNYKIYFSTVPGQAINGTLGCDALLTNSCTVTGLTNGQLYYFALLVTRSSGGDFQSNEVSATPIAAFSILSITSTTNTAAITWNTAAGANSYDISYGKTSLLYTTTVTVNAGGGATQSSTVLSLTPGTQYFFIVKAKNTNGVVNANVEFSTVTTPSAPSGMSIISVGYNSATIQFNNNYSNVAINYKVYHSTQSSFNTTDASAVLGCFVYSMASSPTQLSCVDNIGINKNTKYFFKVVAVTDDIDLNTPVKSLDSSLLNVTTQFDPADLFSVISSSITSTSLVLNWSLNVGSENISYEVYQSDSANASVTGSIINCSPSLTSTAPGVNNICNVNGLSENKNYYFSVKAINNAPYPATTIISPDIIITTKFTSSSSFTVTSSSVTGSTITLKWTFNIGNSIVNFNILQNSSNVSSANISGCTLTGVTPSTSLISCNISGLNENTNYTYVVQATNSATGGSTSISSISIPVLTLPISIPSGLSLSIPSIGTLQARWNAYTAGNEIITYKIYASTSSSVSITAGNLFCTILPNNAIRTSCSNSVVSGNTLVVGITYYFVIVANNSSGSSVASSPAVNILYDTPSNITVPNFTGGPVSGSGIVSASGITLTGNLGTWSDTNSCTYQWYANTIAIVGATGSISSSSPSVTYITSNSDVCRIFSFSVTCTNAIGSRKVYNNSPNNSVGVNTTAVLSDYSTRVGTIAGNTLTVAGKNKIDSFLNQIITNNIPLPNALYALLSDQNAGTGTKIFDLYCDLHNGVMASPLPWDSIGGITSNSSGITTIPNIFSGSTTPTIVAVSRSPTINSNSRGVAGFTGASGSNSFGYGANTSSLVFESFQSNPSTIKTSLSPSRFDFWAVSLNGTTVTLQHNEFQHSDTANSVKNGGLILGSFNNTAGTGLQDYLSMAAAWTTTVFDFVKMETVRRAVQTTMGSTLQNYPKFMYIGNGKPASTVNACNVQSDGSLTGCTQVGAGFSTPTGTARYNNSLYVTNIGGVGVSVCTINPATGALSACSATSTNMPSTGYGLTISKGLNNVYLYVGGLPTKLTKCTIDTLTGALSACTATTTLAGVQGLTFANINSPYLYVTNRTGNSINKCNINPSDGSVIFPCTATGAFLNGPTNISIFNNYAYISNASNGSVVKCSVSIADGTLSSCVVVANSTTPTPNAFYSSTEGVVIINDQIYIANWGNNKVIKCSITLSNGILSNCGSTGTGFLGPIGMSW